MDFLHLSSFSNLSVIEIQNGSHCCDLIASKRAIKRPRQQQNERTNEQNAIFDNIVLVYIFSHTFLYKVFVSTLENRFSTRLSDDYDLQDNALEFSQIVFIELTYFPIRHI